MSRLSDLKEWCATSGETKFLNFLKDYDMNYYEDFELAYLKNTSAPIDENNAESETIDEEEYKDKWAKENNITRNSKNIVRINKKFYYFENKSMALKFMFEEFLREYSHNMRKLFEIRKGIYIKKHLIKKAENNRFYL